jgi:hypothetical protein
LIVCRDFSGSRLEAQVLVRTYELVVPVVRRQIGTARMTQQNDFTTGSSVRTGRLAQGA